LYLKVPKWKYMRNALVLFLLVALILPSCKKDDNGSKEPTQLVKIVTKQGSDSTVAEYTFDSQGRFVQERTTETAGTSTDVTTLSLDRDANGRATRVLESATGSDPYTYQTDYVYLNPTDKKIRNGIFKFDFLGTGTPLQVTDSIAFTYATKVSKTNHYYSATGVPLTQAYYYEYSYDGNGNVTQAKAYQPNSAGVIGLAFTVNFEYDTKTSPVYFNDDVLVEYIGSQYTSPNNPTKVSVVAADPADNFTANTVYEYRSDGRPSKSTTTANGNTFESVYTYKN
jgi:hypothetical protein